MAVETLTEKIKRNVTNAIVEHLTKFAQDIISKYYTKTEVNNKVSDLSNSFASQYITKTNATNLINSKFPINKFKNVSVTDLFNGNATSVGTVELSDSVKNYDYLVVYIKIYKKSNTSIRGYASSQLIKVSNIDIVSSSSEAQFRISVSDANGYYVDFSFTGENNLYIKTLYANGNTAYGMYVQRVEGFKLS